MYIVWLMLRLLWNLVQGWASGPALVVGQSECPSGNDMGRGYALRPLPVAALSLMPEGRRRGRHAVPRQTARWLTPMAVWATACCVADVPVTPLASAWGRTWLPCRCASVRSVHARSRLLATGTSSALNIDPSVVVRSPAV